MQIQPTIASHARKTLSIAAWRRTGTNPNPGTTARANVYNQTSRSFRGKGDVYCSCLNASGRGEQKKEDVVLERQIDFSFLDWKRLENLDLSDIVRCLDTLDMIETVFYLFLRKLRRADIVKLTFLACGKA